jgi:hypothetical protein
MKLPEAYEEVVDFIAAQRARVADLVAHEKADGLTPDEISELELCLQLEHIMRLAKARAWQYLRR